MIAEIISVGTELLLGEILNTNSMFLSKELAKIGINVYNHTTVGDNANRLFKTIEHAFSRADIIITTGGLGPTDDDITKEVVCKYFNKELVLNKDALDNLKKYFNKNEDIPKSNLKQANLPKDCTVFLNDNGTAPGFMIEQDSKIAIVLPGPHEEVCPMFLKVLPYLLKKSDKVFLSKSINLCGIGESAASEMIQDLMQNAKNPTIAPYASNNYVRFRITANAKDEIQAKYLIDKTKEDLYKIFKDYIFSEDDESMEETIVNLLKKNNLTIATAESCTGGLLAAKIINVPSASSVFLNGIVCYSNESKINMINVSESTILKHSAVSKETALEMANGIKNISNTSIGLSITGFAGGSKEEKHTGLIYLAIAYPAKNIQICQKFLLKGNRNKIREKAVMLSFYELFKILK